MNPSKIHYESSILYDKYGNDSGVPLIILEDIFYKNQGELNSFEPLQFREYNLYHIKRLQWETFPFSEKSLLSDVCEKLEDILLHIPGKAILITQGYSSTFAFHLATQSPEKILAMHLFSPLVFLTENQNTMENYRDFFQWWTEGKDPLKNFFALPHLADFFWKYLKFTELLTGQTYEAELNFWLPEQFSIQDSLKFQAKFKGIDIIRVDHVKPREMLHDPKIQKILYWKLKEYSLAPAKNPPD